MYRDLLADAYVTQCEKVEAVELCVRCLAVIQVTQLVATRPADQSIVFIYP